MTINITAGTVRTVFFRSRVFSFHRFFGSPQNNNNCACLSVPRKGYYREKRTVGIQIL